MISLQKLHFLVHHEEVCKYKRFKKFSIKTLTRIAYPNFKYEWKIGQNNLGVNLMDQNDFKYSTIKLCQN